MANRFWVGGDGDWSDTAHWSTTSGGAGGASVPIATDDAVFNANSDVSSADFAVTISDARVIRSISFTSLDVLVTVNGTTNLTVSAQITSNAAAGAFTTAGVKFTSDCTIGTYIDHSSGILDISDIVFTTPTAQVGGATNPSNIIFGTTGKFVITGNNASVWVVYTNFLTCSGNRLAEFTYSGSTGTRTINGGFTGATVDNVISIKIIGGSDILTFSNSRYVKDLDFGTFAGTLSDTSINMFGSLTFSPNMTVTPSASNPIAISGAPGQTNFITSNGLFVDKRINIGIGNTSTATIKLADDLQIGKNLQLGSGTFDANNKNVSVLGLFSSNSNVRTLKMGSGTWTIAVDWVCFTSTNLTVTPDTSTIILTNSLANIFYGGSKTYYNCVLSGLGNVTFYLANFNRLSNTVQPITVLFLENSTTTINDFALAGTVGNQIVISSVLAGTRATLSQASGIINVQYANIKDINAVGGANWNAVNGSFNTGNNRGWYFAHQQNAYYPAGMF